MAEEPNMRRRTKLLLACTFFAILSASYWIISYSRENTMLRDTQALLAIKLKKYTSIFGNCERRLKTAKRDVRNFLEANKHLQSKVSDQEKELRELDKTNAESTKRFSQAYQFFIDVKDIVGEDQSMPERRNVSPEVASALIQEIIKLKSEFEKFKKSEPQMKKALKDLNSTHQILLSRHTGLETQYKGVQNNNKVLHNQLGKRDQIISDKDQKMSNLAETVRQLQQKVKQITSHAKGTRAKKKRTEKQGSQSKSKTKKVVKPEELLGENLVDKIASFVSDVKGEGAV